jgi:hypothetical protein
MQNFGSVGRAKGTGRNRISGRWWQGRPSWIRRGHDRWRRAEDPTRIRQAIHDAGTRAPSPGQGRPLEAKAVPVIRGVVNSVAAKSFFTAILHIRSRFGLALAGSTERTQLARHRPAG